jgi:hypothetical protein
LDHHLAVARHAQRQQPPQNHQQGRGRQNPVGCSAILAEQGMVEVVEEFPLNGHQPDFSVIVYKIAPGFTLDECRAAIKGRHVGPAWGD